MTHALSDAETLRYCRQILIPGFEEDGQEALLGANLLLIGVGGLGCAAAQYLVGAGIGRITLVDDDRVELTNLPRQILHKEASVGQPKVESARQQLSQLNSACQITALAQRLSAEQLTDAVQQHDLVVDCCDNLDTRQLLNQICYANQTPLVSGAAIRCEGQVSSFSMQPGAPCYQCMSRHFGEQQLSCMQSGVLAPVVGIIGATQALEAIKLLTGYGQPLVGRILLLDGSSMEWRSFVLAPDSSCEVCGAAQPDKQTSDER